MQQQQQRMVRLTAPRMGVEPAENGTFRAALYNPLDRSIIRLSDKRLSYGEAYEEAAGLELPHVAIPGVRAA